jgi:tRNA pseudouridine38-40 synthase
VRNIKLVLEYDGTDFRGFQRQRGLRTVQGVLEECFARVLGEQTKAVGAGRTDAGVHALGQVVNFRTSRPVPSDRLSRVLNAALPNDIKVQHCEEVSDDFHARRCARSRTYAYRVIERAQPSPLLGRCALIVPDRLNARRMASAAKLLVGRHDFRAFQGGGAETKTTERRVIRLDCERRGKEISITVEAESFLYQMVRIIASVLLAVGRGEIREEEIAAMLTAGLRPRGLAPAPACGLILLGVSYC